MKIQSFEVKADSDGYYWSRGGWSDTLILRLEACKFPVGTKVMIYPPGVEPASVVETKVREPIEITEQ